MPHDATGESLQHSATGIVAPRDVSGVVLALRDVSKSYGALKVLDGVSLSVREGEFVSVVGPSGSGKTTLLLTIAGLQHPTSGAVVFDGTTVDRPPAGMAIVFQDYSRSLFPWRRNASNVVVGMHRRTDMSKAERLSHAQALLDQVGLGAFAHSYPWQLSGGMQQRVAIARALACDPHMLLLDEPLAAVDAQTRAEVQDLILSLAAKRRQTALLVTHDVEEAVYMAHRVIVLTRAPTRVQEEIDIDLPWPRNQFATREDARFLQLRHHILSLIHASAEPH